MYTPLTDGIDHINIYSAGRTELGRFLSNFTYHDIETEDGKFKSIEGYWFWLLTRDNKLKFLYGRIAKTYGTKVLKEKGKVVIDKLEFERKIIIAVVTKLCTHNQMYNEFKRNKLPLTHYYYYGSINNCNVIPTNSMDFIIRYLEKMKSKL